VSGLPHTPATLFPEEITFIPLNKRLGRPHLQDGQFGEKKTPFSLLEFELWIFQPIA